MEVTFMWTVHPTVERGLLNSSPSQIRCINDVLPTPSGRSAHCMSTNSPIFPSSSTHLPCPSLLIQIRFFYSHSLPNLPIAPSIVIVASPSHSPSMPSSASFPSLFPSHIGTPLYSPSLPPSSLLHYPFLSPPSFSVLLFSSLLLHLLVPESPITSSRSRSLPPFSIAITASCAGWVPQSSNLS